MDSAAATRALATRAEALDPEIATTAFIRADRAGKVFLDSTRSIGATVVAAYSPRIRPGLPVSFPVAWDDLPHVTPADFTVATAPGLLAGGDPWAAALPEPQELPAELIEHGHTIPVARVAAMHEGKRRKRASRSSGAGGAHARRTLAVSGRVGSNGRALHAGACRGIGPECRACGSGGSWVCCWCWSAPCGRCRGSASSAAAS